MSVSPEKTSVLFGVIAVALVVVVLAILVFIFPDGKFIGS